MRKTKPVLALVLLVSFLASAPAFSKGVDSRIYSSKAQPQKMQTKRLGVRADYATDVWVHNRSSYIIWVTVPGFGIDDQLYRGDDDEIFSYSYYPSMHVVLSTQDGYVFFDQYVQNPSDIWVNDVPYCGAKKVGGKSVGKNVQATVKAR